MFTYSTEYLIIHENELNWDELSSLENDSFSLIEIRLFRNKINWKKYLIPGRVMSTSELNIGSKYFTEDDFRRLAAFKITTDDFLLAHPEKFNMVLLFSGGNFLKEDTIVKLKKYWEQIPNIRELIKKSVGNDLKKFQNLTLLLEAES